MAWIRQLPSGLWAATVVTRPGDPDSRITESHELKGVISDWADDLEADIRRGEFIDPRLAKTTVAEVWAKHSGARRLELASRKRDESHWKVHVAPRWGKVAVGSILKPDVQAWVNKMETAHAAGCRAKGCRGCRYGGWTIIAALNVLKAALELAVDAGMIRSNPARRVKAPVPPAHVDRVITAEEERTILARLDDLFPGRRDGRLFVETLFETGGRWEEIAAVSREAVNLRDKLIALGPVMERNGTVRAYPKGARTRNHPGFRDVPIGDALLVRLKPVVLATAKGGLLFTAPQGGALLYPTWLDRVWNLAVHGRAEQILRRAADGAYDPVAFGAWLDRQMVRLGGETDRDLARAAGIRPSLLSSWRSGRFGPGRATADRLAAGFGVTAREVYEVAGLLVPEVAGAGLPEPAPTPHDCRHSYGTRLADDGMEMHDRMALMGHGDVRSGQRYTHSGAGRFDRARAAQKAARGG
jgi:site-specific recombinase XerD